jgi:hypothetical protein
MTDKLLAAANPFTAPAFEARPAKPQAARGDPLAPRLLPGATLVVAGNVVSRA